ncbi:hypothetical protein ACOMHN_021325 [Nucella lapillus]
MELGILHNSPPSTKRGCRAGRLHRLWHGLPPAPWPCTRSQHHSVPSRNLHPLMVPPFLQPHPDLQSAVGNAPLSSKHPAQLPTTDCLLSIISPMGGQPSDAPALSPPSPLQQGGQSSNAPALSPPSPLPQGGQPIALALSPPSPPPQGGQPSDAPGLSPSSSTLLLCPSDSTLNICHLNSQSAVKTGKPETISDYILEQKLDIMILTETWLSESGHETSCSLMTPSGFVLKSYPRASKGGGIAVIFRESLVPHVTFKKALPFRHNLGCVVSQAEPGRMEAELANGLIMGHAYSITAVRLLDLKTPRVHGKIPLVRVRNPWGNECEWKGAWSDTSPEWSMVSERQKHELGLKKDDDGEFWMSFQDFTQQFQKLEVCNLGPDSMDEDNLSDKKRWEVHKEHGTWVKRVSAGGCRNFLETFWTNPQFRMTLSDVDDDDDDDMCTAIIALLQKNRRKKKKEGVDMLTIGYVIYKLDMVQVGTMDMEFFKYNASVAKSPTFINMREVCGRHKLPPGTYVIVPSTFDPNHDGEFLVRIFTEKPNTSGGLDEDTALSDTVKRPEPTNDEQRQEDSMLDNFRAIAGEDLEVDALELQRMLDKNFKREFNFPGFNIEAARSMVAMYDGDMSGKLGYEEFKDLLKDLRHWKGVFKTFDKDHSGKLSSFELRTALNSTGFRLSNRTLQSLVMRYASSDGQVEFSDFITCAVRLKTMINTFRSIDTANQGIAPFGLETFLQTTMYS